MSFFFLLKTSTGKYTFLKKTTFSCTKSRHFHDSMQTAVSCRRVSGLKNQEFLRQFPRQSPQQFWEFGLGGLVDGRGNGNPFGAPANPPAPLRFIQSIFYTCPREVSERENQLRVQKLTRSSLDGVSERDFRKTNLPFLRLIIVLFLKAKWVLL